MEIITILTVWCYHDPWSSHHENFMTTTSCGW